MPTRRRRVWRHGRHRLVEVQPADPPAQVVNFHLWLLARSSRRDRARPVGSGSWTLLSSTTANGG
eukprot:3492673-Pyramimonas_sp.AAC.1